eukprot:GEZU01006374.1.p1 GENE.GEZU01006374.1~~GEZU01006374.1.p1  ORF type:complete len:459 (-),score=119.62 GEZU01006374.1:82-1458(-)
MLHGLRIEDGKATYINKWVRTEKFIQEAQAGKSLYSFFAVFDRPDALLRIIFDAIFKGFHSGGINVANTSVEYHANKFFALVENTLPTEVYLPSLDTAEGPQYDFNGKLTHPFTAHPKIDPVTGELLFFGYQANPKNPGDAFCHFSIASREGEITKTLPITLHEAPGLMHDFAITENYAIFIEAPFFFRKNRMVQGLTPFTFDRSVPTRFGILPRSSTNSDNDIRWFDADPCMIFHVANAFEDGDEVVLYACKINYSTVLGLSSAEEIEEMFRCDLRDVLPFLCEFRFNLKTGQTTRQQVLLPQLPMEFPTINNGYTGRRNKYIYGIINRLRPDNPDHIREFKSRAIKNGTVVFESNQLVKFNREDGSYRSYRPQGERTYVGEFVFVPRYNNNGEQVDEDDGYLVTFTYDEQANRSFFVVVDARDLSERAQVPIPRRVPFGFHGKWISQAQLATMKQR